MTWVAARTPCEDQERRLPRVVGLVGAEEVLSERGSKDAG